MIRLTLLSCKEPEIHLLNKPTILVGSDQSQADLVLSSASIHPIHLKIVKQGQSFFAINAVNDPFLSINQFPFGKKELTNGDKIQIDAFEIEFEQLPNASEKPQETDNLPNQEPASVQRLSQEEPLLQLHYSFEKEVQPLSQEEINLEAVEELISPFLQEKPCYQNTAAGFNKPKNNYSTEQQPSDAELLPEENDLKKTSRLTFKKKFILALIIFLLIIGSFLASFIYLTISEKSQKEELKATQGIADVALALTHARLYQVKPHNQNWLDSDFLQSNLQSVIPNIDSYALKIDGQGRFHCCPYTLRIYTDRDLSRFLLIAQPTSNVSNHFFSKSIIVIDSQLMELRAFKDVRALNRLLARSEPLEGANGIEIINLVKEGTLIRPTDLGRLSNHPDFCPPKNVAWIKPTAENYIYNAPRYYRLAQNLLQQAILLSTSKGSGQEVTKLKADVANFSELTHLILYSDDLNAALLSKRSIMLFAPCDKFLFGYLKKEKETILGAQLLRERDEKKALEVSQIEDLHRNSSSDLALDTTSLPKENSKSTLPNNDEKEIDFNHPIYIQLKALIATRESDLRPLSAAIYHLLNQELDFPKSQFQAEFQNLYHTYLITDSRHKQEIKEIMLKLYQQYEEMPIEQFFAYMDALHLDQMICQKEGAMQTIDENCIQNLKNLFKHIQKCQSITELDNLVHISLTWLNFDYLRDPKELIKYQNYLRNHILDQLKAFLICDEKLVKVKREDASTLMHLLAHERLIRPEEKEYFLSEFNEMIDQTKEQEEMVRELYES